MFSALVPTPPNAVDALATRGRIDDLDGATIAIVNNGKPRTVELLTYITDELRSQYPGINVIGPFRTDSAHLASDGQLDDIAGRCDVVINGLGDCGSCSAGSIHVATDFERRGIPAVAICTRPFIPTAQAVAVRRGMPGYRFVAVEHPLSSLPSDELRERARDAVVQVLDILGATRSAKVPAGVAAGKA